MAGKILLLSALLTGVLSRRPQGVYIEAGEMVALWCPPYKGLSDTSLVWTSHKNQEADVITNMSSAEQRRIGVLLHGKTLVILRADINHQGNYSCSYGNASRQFWFRLTVYTTQSREYEETTYSKTCYTQESCTLHCPDVNIPDENTPNMTSNGIMWHKKGDFLPNGGYFPSVEESDRGVYTCTRSYLYNLQNYNITFTVLVDVLPSTISGKTVILSPHHNDVFHVTLGSKVVINCTAVIYSDFDEVFWLSGTSFVERNNSLPVFYNYTRESNGEGMRMTASLVLKKVSEKDLGKNYTCKLESDDEPSSFVTITLAQKASSFSVLLLLAIVGIIMMIFFVTIVCVEFKRDVSLFLQDSHTCYRSISDGKQYDAILIYYKSKTGLNEGDRECLERVLGRKYSLYPYDPNTSLKKETVLDYINQSWTVALVPAASDPSIGTDLLKDINVLSLERKTRLVFIKSKSNEVSKQGRVPEALQLLRKLDTESPGEEKAP